MGAIYGASLVTIVATGDNATTGLPGVSPGSRAAEAYEEMPLGNRTYQLVSGLPTLDRELGKSTWLTRGWTFQEFLLSRRVVVFSPAQVYFTCAQGEQAEVYAPNGLFSDEYWQRHVHRQRMSASLSDDVTATMIEDFCNRKLTHCQDRFNAFMGVAELQNPESVATEDVTALRGLPFLSFWESLLWSPQGSEVSTRIKNNLDHSFALPSWSWVGWSGPVTMPRRNPRPRYNSKSWVEAMVLDDANVVLKPTGSQDVFFLWEPWPFEPEVYSGNIPDAVTLHMWAPCVNCHLISMEGMATCPVRYPPLQGDRTVCHMIFEASPDLTTEVLDDLAQNCVDPGGRSNFIGFIWRQKDRSQPQPHRHTHQIIVFPWEGREETSLLLLEGNPDDEGTVCRAAVVDDPRLFISASGIPHAPDERHTHNIRHRYLRMQ